MKTLWVFWPLIWATGGGSSRSAYRRFRFIAGRWARARTSPGVAGWLDAPADPIHRGRAEALGFAWPPDAGGVVDAASACATNAGCGCRDHEPCP